MAAPETGSKKADENRNRIDRNWRRFVLFRVLFNARFYHPVLAVPFLDLGLSATQCTLLNFPNNIRPSDGYQWKSTSEDSVNFLSRSLS